MRGRRNPMSPDSPRRAAAAAVPEIELGPVQVELGSAVGGGGAAAIAAAGGASFPANPRDFTAVAPNKRAAASSAGNSPLPDLSPLGEEDDEAEEDMMLLMIMMMSPRKLKCL